jgi:hypothetical protein
MALHHCVSCTAAYLVGLARCPQCGSEERTEEPVKITRAGVSTGPGDMRPREHPGAGVPMEGTEHPADGTMSPLVSNDDGEPGEQVAQLPPGELAEPEPYHITSGDPGVHAEGLEVLKVPAEGAKAPAVPPKAPPRRPPSAPKSVPDGG